MNGKLVAINQDELEALAAPLPGIDLPATLRLGRFSDPVFAGWFVGELMCLVGFAPRTTLSDSAYLWMFTTEAGRTHPLLLARWGRRLVGMALQRYPRLFGHCTPGSERWLRSLGATLGPPESGLATFNIGA